MADDPVNNPRAALEQVNSVTLPKIYREIGRRVAKSPKVPAALKHHFDSIARLKPAADAQDAAAVAQLREAYAALGRDAVALYGEKAIPKDIAPLLADAIEKQKSYSTLLQRGPVVTPPPTKAPEQREIDCFPVGETVSPGKSAPRVRRCRPGLAYSLIGGLAAIAVVGMAAVVLWPGLATRGSSARHSRSPAKTNTHASGSSPEALLDDVDPAVLLVLGKTSDTNREHGFAGVDLGETYAQVDESHRLQRDRRYPWVFRSSQHTRGVECVFDEKDLLRAVTQVVNGGPEQHGEGLLEIFGQTPYDEITRVTNSSNSRTMAKLLYYVFPLAQTITVVQFSDTRYVQYRQVESMAETRVTVADLPWAVSILDHSAKTKRPLLEWMRNAADVAAAGNHDLDSLPAVPGTGVKVVGNKRERLILMLGDETPDGKRKRGKHDRQMAKLMCIPKQAIAAMPGEAGVDVDFRKYSLISGDKFLKGDIPPSLASVTRGEALWNTPAVAFLEQEITRVLLQEYFPPQDGRYVFEESRSVGSAGYYRWTSVNERGNVFNVICNTNGSSGAFVVGKE